MQQAARQPAQREGQNHDKHLFEHQPHAAAQAGPSGLEPDKDHEHTQRAFDPNLGGLTHLLAQG
jgi:hypothetical protein